LKMDALFLQSGITLKGEYAAKMDVVIVLIEMRE
jgi:hypothetical protein